MEPQAEMSFEDALQEVTRLQQMFHGVQRVHGALEKAARAEPLLAELHKQEEELKAKVRQLDSQRHHLQQRIEALKTTLADLQAQTDALKARVGGL